MISDKIAPAPSRPCAPLAPSPAHDEQPVKDRKYPTIPSPDHIVLKRRQSPGWHGLARDRAAGSPIDPGRYLPPSSIPGFPADIVACIEAWNATFSADFFRCRAILKEIFDRPLAPIARAVVLDAVDTDGLAAASTRVHTQARGSGPHTQPRKQPQGGRQELAPFRDGPQRDLRTFRQPLVAHAPYVLKARDIMRGFQVRGREAEILKDAPHCAVKVRHRVFQTHIHRVNVSAIPGGIASNVFRV